MFFLIFFFAMSWIFSDSQLGVVKLGDFFGEQWLGKITLNFGDIPLFKKESDCAFFPDFPDFFKGPATLLGYSFLKW